MHHGENFNLYENYLGSGRLMPHQVNCGHFNPSPSKSRPQTRTIEKQNLMPHSDSQSKSDDFKGKYSGDNITSSKETKSNSN